MFSLKVSPQRRPHALKQVRTHSKVGESLFPALAAPEPNRTPRDAGGDTEPAQLAAYTITVRVWNSRRGAAITKAHTRRNVVAVVLKLGAAETLSPKP